MKIPGKYFLYLWSWVILCMLLSPQGLMAQDYTETDHTVPFTKAELTQLLAPIALYPDSLITQILMASTYPVELVEAERWLKVHENLKAADLDTALQGKPWDLSIKSLCHFPEILYMMSEELEQTAKLGDAFLVQQDEVMDTIQDLRRIAHEQETLKTTKEQKVIVERKIIRIEPANPQVIYVPVYNPLYVYGPWWYPAYPPYSWYYPMSRVYTRGFVGFGSGFIVGIGISSWTWCDWHHHHIYIDRHKTKRFHKYRRDVIEPHKYVWKHTPLHRHRVPHKHSPVSTLYTRKTLHDAAVKSKAAPVHTLQNMKEQTGKTFRRSTDKQVRSHPHVQKIDPRRNQTVKSRGNTFSNGTEKKYERRKSDNVSVRPKNVRSSGQIFTGNDSYESNPRFIRQENKLHKMAVQDTVTKRSLSKEYMNISRSITSHPRGTISKSLVGRTYANTRHGGKMSGLSGRQD